MDEPQPAPADDDTPTGDEPTGDEPTGDEPTGDKPTRGKPTGDEPTGDKPTGDRPAVRAGVDYKGAPLDAERGPGLGCFWLQVVVLVVVMFLAPLSAAWEWPVPITIVLLASTLVLLLFVGQTVIFLLRLIAADRRTVRADGRRRPMSSATKTVGEIEDEAVGEEGDADSADDVESRD